MADKRRRIGKTPAIRPSCVILGRVESRVKPDSVTSFQKDAATPDPLTFTDQDKATTWLSVLPELRHHQMSPIVWSVNAGFAEDVRAK